MLRIAHHHLPVVGYSGALISPSNGSQAKLSNKMNKEKAKNILNELIEFYIDGHKDDEGDYVMGNIDDFERYVEVALDAIVD